MRPCLAGVGSGAFSGVERWAKNTARLIRIGGSIFGSMNHKDPYELLERSHNESRPTRAKVRRHRTVLYVIQMFLGRFVDINDGCQGQESLVWTAVIVSGRIRRTGEFEGLPGSILTAGR
jgi:hypothetical protein